MRTTALDLVAPFGTPMRKSGTRIPCGWLGRDILADRIAVLYHGELVEEGTGAEVLGAPQHPYTKRLLASLPVPNPAEQAKRREELRLLRSEA